MRLLVGYGNRCRQGKDLAAAAVMDYLNCKRTTAKSHGYGITIPDVRVFKFAQALYLEAKRDYGMTDKDAPLLQRIGMERRDQDPEYWVKQVRNQLASFNGIALITDVRFQNEIQMVKELGGFTVQMIRLNQDGTRFYSDDRPSGHPSESELDNHNWDYRISTKTGEEALSADYAVTLIEHLLGLTHGR